MRWLGRRAGPPDPEVALQRVADELRAAATAAPPSERADEIRASLLARLDDQPRSTSRLGPSAAWLVVPLLLLLIGLVGLLGGTAAEPTPAPAVPSHPQPSERTTDVPVLVPSPGASSTVESEEPAAPPSPPVSHSPATPPATGRPSPSLHPTPVPQPTPPSLPTPNGPPMSLPPLPSLGPSPNVP